MTNVSLTASNIEVSLNGDEVVNVDNLEIYKGKWTCIVGPNGAGKSTLLRALAGLIKHSGSVDLPLLSCAANEPFKRAQYLAWFGQNEESPDELSVYNVTMLGRLPYQGILSSPSADDHIAVKEALESTQSWNLRNRALADLSGGERQRVLLSRALAVNAEILMLDEPISNLDPQNQADLIAVIRGLTKNGKTVLSVLHEITFGLMADEIWVLNNGRIISQGHSSDPKMHLALEQVFDYRIKIYDFNGLWISIPKI
jgi:iron complex transport system ATP-binding protein